MITVQEARNLILQHSQLQRTAVLPLKEAFGMVLSENLHAITHIPPFPQSAMDGYAFAYSSLSSHSVLKIVGEVQAGETQMLQAVPGEALRIFTGAAVPPGCDTVVMQEKCIAENGTLRIEDPMLQPGSNVRPQGSQSNTGDLLLPAGHRLSPASVAFLASSGIDSVPVKLLPRVRILVTGKELVTPGSPLQYGQVYECNSFGLSAALAHLGIPALETRIADDNEEEIRQSIKELLQQTDVLLITGGVSVGDYDYVHSALQQNGIEKIFHKIRQKPGKPIWFGKQGNTLVFGLPGNPASVLTCFYEYAVPALQQISGIPMYFREQLQLAETFTKKPGLTQFLKAKREGNTVRILPDQNSYLLNSFAHADLLAEIPEEAETTEKGELITVTRIY